MTYVQELHNLTEQQMLQSTQGRNEPRFTSLSLMLNLRNYELGDFVVYQLEKMCFKHYFTMIDTVLQGIFQFIQGFLMVNFHLIKLIIKLIVSIYQINSVLIIFKRMFLFGADKQRSRRYQFLIINFMKHILGLFYCILYGGCSFCFSLSVKYLWIKFQFRMTFMLLLYENILTAIICLFMGKRNHSSKDTLLYSFIYSLQTFSGMKGLQIMNISMYMTLRRTLILFVFMMQKSWKISNFMSVIFITLGAIIAGQEHLDENYLGYGLILMNNVFNALALHKSKQLNYEKQIDPLELLFQNSCNQIPFLFIGAYASQELHDFMTTTYMSEQFLIAFTLVALMGFMLCYSTNLCNMYNSPIAIAITHNIKDILITSYSFFFLKEEYDFQILAGIIISYLGSILYSIQKVKEIKSSLYLPLSSNDKDQKQD